MTHELKTWPEPFQAVLDDAKRFEFRKNDRGFMVGDTLHLREWDPSCPDVGTGGIPAVTQKGYTGREAHARITYLLRGPAFGIPADCAILSIERCWA